MNVVFPKLALRQYTLATAIVLGFSAGSLPFSHNAWAQQTQSAVSSETVTLALDNADVRDLIRWAQDVTDKSIIVHPNVKGKVTVMAGDPMTRGEAYQVFLSVLQVHGFATVEGDNSLKIIPDALAKQSSVPLIDKQHQSGQEDVVVRILKVRNVSATQLVNLLRPLVPQVGHLAAYPATNALIIADRASNIGKVMEIVSRLDKVGVVDIELLPLEFASAKEVLGVINKLLPKAQGKGAEGGSGLQLAVDERSNSLLLTGDPATRQQIRKLVKRLDQPLSGEGNTQVFHLNYANAKDLVEVLESVSGSVQKNEKDQGTANIEVSIKANEALNALIVTAPPSILNTMKGVIAKLDVRRPQVLVEALIVEVNEDLGHDFGVEWRTSSTGDVRTGFRSFPNAIEPGTTPATDISLGSGISLGYFRGGELRALINALATETNANILSTPTIMALDNEEAEILVGENVPIITGNESREGNENPFQTIERQDVGIFLKVKPRINRDNSVTLDIEQSVESVTENSEQGVITNKREIKTRVLIGNNETLVLGGLMTDELEETESKVPFLGDIPGLGRLFKSTSTDTVKRNLMVFIHPTILTEADSGYELTSKRYHEMQNRQRNFRDKVETYFVPRDIPELPELPKQPVATSEDASTTTSAADEASNE